MIFCPTCGNMLVLSTAMDVGYYFICQSCPYKHEIENGVGLQRLHPSVISHVT
eukprot:m.14713 g.14713  ORF g.14713 m.14713 type:complete len:53 (+) comp10332_c0_seq2:121-279(+)